MVSKSHVITVAAQKGGAGKTTITCHLAVQAERAGLATLIVDADPQRSATHWWDRRHSDRPHLVEADTGNLRDRLAEASSAGYEMIFVDTPPHAATLIEEAIRFASLCLVPCRPTPLDVDAVASTLRLAKAHQVAAAIVLSACLPPPATLADETADLLRAEHPDATLSPVRIGQRIDYQRAMIDGRAVSELGGNARKSAAEVDELFRWVRRSLR